LYGTYLFYSVKERRRKYRNQICIIAAEKNIKKKKQDIYIFSNPEISWPIRCPIIFNPHDP